MKTLTLVILMMGLSNSAFAAKNYTCTIVTGYGTAIGTGSTPLKAKEAAREICGDKMIDQYSGQRGQIPNEVVDDLVLACVNLECEK